MNTQLAVQEQQPTQLARPTTVLAEIREVVAEPVRRIGVAKALVDAFDLTGPEKVSEGEIYIKTLKNIVGEADDGRKSLVEERKKELAEVDTYVRENVTKPATAMIEKVTAQLQPALSAKAAVESNAKTGDQAMREVRTFDGVDTATASVTTLRRVAQLLEQAHKCYLAAAQNAVTWVPDQVRFLEEKAKAAQKAWANMGDEITDAETRDREAAEAAAKAHAQAQADKAVDGATTQVAEMVRPVEPEQVQLAPLPEVAGPKPSSFKIENINLTLLPQEFFTVNEAAIVAALKAGKSVPGVTATPIYIVRK